MFSAQCVLCKCHPSKRCCLQPTLVCTVHRCLVHSITSELAIFTVQVTVRPWPKTLYETDASGAPVPCTCYYYVGMKKKQARHVSGLDMHALAEV
jgi:hypothetical protein